MLCRLEQEKLSLKLHFYKIAEASRENIKVQSRFQQCIGKRKKKIKRVLVQRKFYFCYTSLCAYKAFHPLLYGNLILQDWYNSSLLGFLLMEGIPPVILGPRPVKHFAHVHIVSHQSIIQLTTKENKQIYRSPKSSSRAKSRF